MHTVHAMLVEQEHQVHVLVLIHHHINSICTKSGPQRDDRMMTHWV
jgi:hypothetical protein